MMEPEHERSFRSNAVWAVSCQAASVGLGFLSAIIVARALGPRGQGMVALALLIPGLLALLLGLGLPVGTAYFAGNKTIPDDELVTTTLFVSAAATVGGAIVAALVVIPALKVHLVPGLPTPLLVLGLALLPLTLTENGLGGILQGRGQIAALSVIELVQSVASFALTLIGIRYVAHTVGIVINAYVAAAVLALALTLRTTLKGTSVSRLTPRPIMLVLRFGMVAYLGNLVQFLTYRLDVLVLNVFTGASAVGLYSISYRMAEVLWVVPTSIATVVLSHAVRRAPDARTSAAVNAAFWMSLTASAVMAVVIAAAARPLLVALFGRPFVGSYRPLVLLLPGVVLLGGGSVLASDIAGRGYPRLNAINAAVGLVSVIALDLLLVPRYGSDGAAVASSIAYAINAVLAFAFYSSVTEDGARDLLRDFRWWRFVLRLSLRARPGGEA